MHLLTALCFYAREKWGTVHFPFCHALLSKEKKYITHMRWREPWHTLPRCRGWEQSLHFKCKVDHVIRVMCCFWCKTTVATVIETGEPKELWYKLNQGFLTPCSALTQTGFYIPGVEIQLHAALKRWSANLFVMWIKQITSTNSECFWYVHLLCLFKSPAQSLEADLV